MQIRYSSSKNALPRRLREIFPYTTAYAKKCDEYKEMGLSTPKLSESDKEFVDIMVVNDGFEFVCYPNGNVFEADEKVEPECETEIIARPTIVTTQSDTSRQETIDSAASNTNTMNFLIAKGKFRGYIKESEILAAFPEGTDVEKFEEILATINDNGIELRWE